MQGKWKDNTKHIIKDNRRVIYNHEDSLDKDIVRLIEQNTNRLLPINTRRRKIIQTQAHKRDRMRLKQWLAVGDYDTLIATHATAKSILWEIW